MFTSHIFATLTSLLFFASSTLALTATNTGADGVQLGLAFATEFVYVGDDLHFSKDGGSFKVDVKSSKVELVFPVVFKIFGSDENGNTEDWWKGEVFTANQASDLPLDVQVQSLDELEKISKGNDLPAQIGIRILNNKVEPIHTFKFPWGDDK